MKGVRKVTFALVLVFALALQCNVNASARFDHWARDHIGRALVELVVDQIDTQSEILAENAWRSNRQRLNRRTQRQYSDFYDRQYSHQNVANYRIQLKATDRHGEFRVVSEYYSSQAPTEQEQNYLRLILRLWESGQVYYARSQRERDYIYDLCTVADIFCRYDGMELRIGHNWW